MAALIDLFNRALIEAEQPTIADPDGDEAGAGTLRDAWPLVRQAILRAHPWNFAIRRAGLAADTEAPAWGWAYAFTLPADPLALRILRISGEPRYAIERRRILTDQAAPLDITFVGDITDVSEWDAATVEAAALHLASATCLRFKADKALRRDLADRAALALRTARSLDAQEGTPERPVEWTWGMERL